MKVITLTDKVSVRSFEDWADFLEFAQRETDCGYRLSRKGTDKWSGGASHEEAMLLARNGWPEGLKLIEKLSSRVKTLSAQLVTRPQVSWDVTGDCVDIGRFVSGEPENMMIFEEEVIHGTGKVVTVRIDMAASGSLESHDIMHRGAAALALVDCLENAGRSCEVILTECCYSEGRIEHLITIKKPGSHADMDLLAFSAAHPASLRRIMFSALEVEPSSIRRNVGIGGNYGMPCASEHCPAEIVIPSLCGVDGPKLLAWMESELQKQGIETERL